MALSNRLYCLPHLGEVAFTKRLVRSVKLILRKTLGKSFLTFEELQAILCEMEYLITVGQ